MSNEMKSPLEETKEDISLHLTLGVILGELDGELAAVWQDAIEALSESDMAQLVRKTRGLSCQEVASITLLFLMQRDYPFRELVMYKTDDEFKQRMGLKNVDFGDFL